jgi:signal transduction histidine kinase
MFIPNDETIQQEKLFREMFETLPVAVTLIDRNGFLKFGNNAFLVLTASDPSLVAGQSFNWLLHGNSDIPVQDAQQSRKERALDSEPGIPEKGALLSGIVDKCWHQGSELSEFILKVPGSDRRLRMQVTKLSEYLCCTLTLMEENPAVDQNVAAQPTSALASQNKVLVGKLEEIGQHNRDLERSNQDLSQYAYVASHDLQEPLRKIRIFSDILIGSGQLNGKEKFIANKIMTASERMSLLVRDLLNYSKLLKADAVFEEVDLNEIVKAVLVDFEIKINENNAIVRFPDLPPVHGVKLQLNQLFYNLLGNALKFTIPGQPPEVDISVQEITDIQARQFTPKVNPGSKYLHIRFVDNGIGFEPEKSEQIFEVFRRLYPREVYEGSGIGLALCRRIVQNHSGSLFATSEPGKGSAFNIVIPTRQPDSGAKKKGQNEDSAPL